MLLRTERVTASKQQHGSLLLESAVRITECALHFSQERTTTGPILSLSTSKFFSGGR